MRGMLIKGKVKMDIDIVVNPNSNSDDVIIAAWGKDATKLFKYFEKIVEVIVKTTKSDGTKLIIKNGFIRTFMKQKQVTLGKEGELINLSED